MPQAQIQDQASPYVGIMGILGRNGSDTRFTIPDRQCREALNVDWFRSSLGRKRGGSDVLASPGFVNGVRVGYRHVPGSDQTAAELWVVDGAGTFWRYSGGAWSNPTVKDPLTGSVDEVNFQSFNGKLYVCYKSGLNRLHVWDGATLRRVGLKVPAAAPTLGTVSAGAVTDTREYRVSWAVQSGGVTILRSNLSPASASQALAAQQVVVNQPATAGEGETHWEIWGASTTSSFADYRLLATVAIGTTTYSDNTASLPSKVSPSEGANTPPPSVKYLVAEGSRLIMGGAYEVTTDSAMTPKSSRLWYTPALGASDVGDDERISNTGTINGYADLEESIAGISQPMQLVSAQASSLERGSFYVFSYLGQWKFISTGDATNPYVHFRITGGRGVAHHKSLVTAEDSNGNPSIYWVSGSNVMRISTNGQEFCGEDIVDVWATVNLDATIPAHAVFYPDLHQIWFFLATSGSSYPNVRMVLDTRLGQVTGISGVRQGWAKHTGEGANAYCSFLSSDVMGASMGRALKPHIGHYGTSAVWKCDTTSTTDGGTTFQGYVESKSYSPWGLGRLGGLRKDAILVAAPSAGVQIEVRVFRNEGQTVNVSFADLTPRSDSKSEESVFVPCEGSALADSGSLRVRIGDAQASSATWNLDGLVVPTTEHGDR